MKFIRAFFTSIFGIVLTALIFALNMTYVIEDVVQNKFVASLIKDVAVENYIESPNSELTQEEKDMLRVVVEDKDVSKLVDIVIDNYVLYTTDKNYSVSKKDVDTITKYLVKHLDGINKLSNGSDKLTEQDIYDNFTVENVDKYAKEAFKYVNDSFDDDTNDVIDIYLKLVSPIVKLSIGLAIVIIILLIIFINWSFVKWIVPTGVSLLMAGIFTGIIYSLLDFVKTYFFGNVVNVKLSITAVSFINIFILAIFEMIGGIVLIVVGKNIKKSDKEAKVEKTNEDKSV